MEETGVPERTKSLTNLMTYYWIEYTSPWTGSELTTLMVLITRTRTTWKENFHSINNYMHRRCTVVWTQRNGTHSGVANNKPQYPMITGATLNELINMKTINTRKDYRYWKFSILKEHFFHSPLEILLFNKKKFNIYELYRYSESVWLQ